MRGAPCGAGQSRGREAQEPGRGDAESIAAGQQLYLRKCASCHGRNGEGGPGNDLIPAAPSLLDDSWDHGSTDGEIFDNIKNGVAPDFNMVPVQGQAEGRRHLERRELHPVDRKKKYRPTGKMPILPVPTLAP